MANRTLLKSLPEPPDLARQLKRDHLRPPTRFNKLAELEVIPLFLSNVFGLQRKKNRLKGNGRPVMLLPGFQAGEWTMQPMLRYLRQQGFKAVHWGLGRNTGDVAALAPRVTDAVLHFAKSCGRPVALVGWSLGGYLARESARDLPEHVDEVVTFGTPAWGGPKYTAAAWFYEKQGLSVDEIENGTLQRFENPIRQKLTAFYNKRDGVVNWECCIDHWSPYVTHREIDCPHLGMAFSAEIQYQTALVLAAAP